MLLRPPRHATFRTPPGWPPPPPGWRPGKGWQPDTSWPAAPVGWEFWVRGRWLTLMDVLVAVACFVAAGLAWTVWMQWGQGPGDYASWRVIGLVLTLLVVCVPPAWQNWAPSVIVALAPGLAVSAFLDWAKDDDSGLFVVGVFFIFVGTLSVTATLALIVSNAGSQRRRQASLLPAGT